MIRGYPERPSVGRGGRIVLHVASGAPRFRVRFHRVGATIDVVDESAWLPGVAASAGLADADWHWPAYPFTIGDWPSGVYVGELLADATVDAPLSLAATDAAALFVVRGDGRRALLYKLTELDKDGSFNPQAVVTRADAAILVYNAVKFAEAHKEDALDMKE